MKLVFKILIVSLLITNPIYSFMGLFDDKIYYKENSFYSPPGKYKNVFSIQMKSLPVCIQAGIKKKEEFIKSSWEFGVSFNDDFGNIVKIGFVTKEGQWTGYSEPSIIEISKQNMIQDLSVLTKHPKVIFEESVNRKGIDIHLYCIKCNSWVETSNGKLSTDVAIGVLNFFHDNQFLFITYQSLDGEGNSAQNTKHKLLKVFDNLRV